MDLPNDWSAIFARVRLWQTTDDNLSDELFARAQQTCQTSSRAELHRDLYLDAIAVNQGQGQLSALIMLCDGLVVLGRALSEETACGPHELSYLLGRLSDEQLIAAVRRFQEHLRPVWQGKAFAAVWAECCRAEQRPARPTQAAALLYHRGERRAINSPHRGLDSAL